MSKKEEYNRWNFDCQKMNEKKAVFKEFLEEGVSAENRDHFGAAISNYYKALTVMCSYIIVDRLGKTPKNHTEIFLFLKVSFPDIHAIVDEVFKTYTDSYNSLMKKEDCLKIKNAIKETAKIGNIEKEFAEDLKKI